MTVTATTFSRPPSWPSRRPRSPPVRAPRRRGTRLPTFTRSPSPAHSSPWLPWRLCRHRRRPDRQPQAPAAPDHAARSHARLLDGRSHDRAAGAGPRAVRRLSDRGQHRARPQQQPPSACGSARGRRPHLGARVRDGVRRRRPPPRDRGRSYLLADRLGIGHDIAVRGAFFAVGVGGLGFAVPLAIRVPEPPGLPLAHGATGSPSGMRSFACTARCGISAVNASCSPCCSPSGSTWRGSGRSSLLATAYGAALGLPTAALIGTLLVTQFVAFPTRSHSADPDPTASGRGARSRWCSGPRPPSRRSAGSPTTTAVSAFRSLSLSSLRTRSPASLFARAFSAARCSSGPRPDRREERHRHRGWRSTRSSRSGGSSCGRRRSSS